MTKINHGHLICLQDMCKRLRKWANGTLKSLRFGVPMVWREPHNIFNECYFCLVDLKRFNCHNKKTTNCPDLEFARRPVPHCEELPLPEFSDLLDVFMEYGEFHEEVKSSASDSGGNVFESSLSIPEQFKQRGR